MSSTLQNNVSYSLGDGRGGEGRGREEKGGGGEGRRRGGDGWLEREEHTQVLSHLHAHIRD